MEKSVNIFWFRRDLRLDDNAGLYHALKGELPVIPIFIFDKCILDELEDKEDQRVEFIRAAIIEIQDRLVEMNAAIEVYYGTPLETFNMLIKKYSIKKVLPIMITNHMLLKGIPASKNC